MDDPESVQHGELLGEWVRRRRAELGVPADKIVDRMGPGVPQNYVTQLENGGRKRMISQPRFGLLVRALESTELDALIGAGLVTERIAQPSAASARSKLPTPQRDLIRCFELLNARDRARLVEFARVMVDLRGASPPGEEDATEEEPLRASGR